VVSLFLMLFSVSMTDSPAVLTLMGLYSAVGSVWLMLMYWTGLRHSFVATETAVTLEVQPGRERLPWLAVLVVVGLVGSVLGLVAIGPQRAARVLGEWLPTSGGTGGYDPFARGGVNDGDDEVKGESPRSTGMTQTDSFLDSPLPSLYDMISEQFGEPFKPRDQERSIALDPLTRGNESKKTPADNLRPNREFATMRKSPRRPRDPSDRAARAIFEVHGRTPLHVRVAAFDVFDGLNWQEASVNVHTCRLEKERGSCWMRVIGLAEGAIFAERESHQFKMTRPDGSLVPTPPYLRRVRIGRVDQVAFFAWGQDPPQDAVGHRGRDRIPPRRSRIASHGSFHLWRPGASQAASRGGCPGSSLVRWPRPGLAPDRCRGGSPPRGPCPRPGRASAQRLP
jgi:hypothetical protein